MLFKMTEFTMNGDEVFGFDELQHHLHLFLAGMSRDMYGCNRVVDNVRTALEKSINGSMDHFLVSGYRMGGHDYRILREQFEMAICSSREPAQYGRRLTLSSCTHQYDL